MFAVINSIIKNTKRDIKFHLLIKKGEHLNIYNIGSGKSHSAREIINIISAHIPSIHYSVSSNGDKLLIQDCICDNSLFSKDFSWQPKTSMEDGIAKIIKHAELD